MLLAANGSRYVIEFTIRQLLRITQIKLFFLISCLIWFLRSDLYKKREQVLLAANGSGYVIEFIIWQHPSITLIQKYIYCFYLIRFLRSDLYKSSWRASAPGCKWL